MERRFFYLNAMLANIKYRLSIMLLLWGNIQPFITARHNRFLGFFPRNFYDLVLDFTMAILYTVYVNLFLRRIAAEGI